MPLCRATLTFPSGGGQQYEVEAGSSMEAAAKAIVSYPGAIEDDWIVTVSPNSEYGLTIQGTEHNRRQPKYRHRVGTVREWMRDRIE